MMRQPRRPSPSEERRLFVGLMVQPFLASGLSFIVFPVLLRDRSGRTLAGGFPLDITDAARSVAIGAGLVAFFVTLLGALPTALWLTKRKQVSLKEAVLFGLGFGNVPLILGTVLAGSYGVGGFVRGMAFSSLLGVTGAAAFWSIALRGEKFPGNPEAGEQALAADVRANDRLKDPRNARAAAEARH